jgi:hypothetical protein
MALPKWLWRVGQLRVRVMPARDVRCQVTVYNIFSKWNGTVHFLTLKS